MGARWVRSPIALGMLVAAALSPAANHGAWAQQERSGAEQIVERLKLACESDEPLRGRRSAGAR